MKTKTTSNRDKTSSDSFQDIKNMDFMDIVGDRFEIDRGQPLPLGATITHEGINFAVFSGDATSVTLVLYKRGDEMPIVEFPLDPRFNRTGDIWHALFKDLPPVLEYGYRVDKKPNDKKHIHLFDPKKVLIDPYAKALSGGEVWGKIRKSGPRRTLRSLIVDDDFDWGFDQTLNTPLEDTIIYELHVRGFTKHHSSGVEHPGTYAGLIEKIPYLKDLGVTAVELLPVNEFSEIDNAGVYNGEQLVNYWGYNSIGFFAPKASYASQNSYGRQVWEFKSMVKAFHHAGIEVFLDIVFNHSGEGNQDGPIYSFRGLGNDIYYLIDPETGEYHNYSGCGNTINCNHPVVRDTILNCLHFWVMEMHVDGFRFDLASILGRGRDGSVLANPPLLERIAADPVLRNTKLIAEAWDAAGLYQVGTFPSWGRWAEWNAVFRDDVRNFLRGDPGYVTALANRLAGSPDIYSRDNDALQNHINFVTCHDGFTLGDLVSYNSKHNEMNGENGRDGSDSNNSWNCGYEGYLDAEDRAKLLSRDQVARLRQRQIKNFASILLLSRGVPMILGGDEIGRTQRGNNNAYCQDNEISWIDWRFVDKNADLLRFFKTLIKFRKKHPVLKSGHCRSDDKSACKVTWHGTQPNVPDLSMESRSIAIQLSNYEIEPGIDIYIVCNAYWELLNFRLPSLESKRKWYRVIDTVLPTPEDISDPGAETLLTSQNSYDVGPRSFVVLLGK